MAVEHSLLLCCLYYELIVQLHAKNLESFDRQKTEPLVE